MDVIQIVKDYTGTTDGTVVSSNTWLEPVYSGLIIVPVEEYNTGDPISLAIRCNTDWTTREKEGAHARLFLVGDNAFNWRLALTEIGLDTADWGNSIEFTSQIEQENVPFWIQGRARYYEQDGIVRAAQIRAEAQVEGV